TTHILSHSVRHLTTRSPRMINNINRKVQSIPCEEICVGARYRKEMGDLSELAASIARVGLLQPVGVTRDGVLVFGERRLRAVRDILKQPMIDAVVIDVPSIAQGEHDENEVRKDFTPSERVAIAAALKQEYKSRQGQRTDLLGNGLVEKVPQ